MNKKTLYLDMDGVIVDFESGLAHVDDKLKTEYEGHYDDIPGLFSKMTPIPGAIDAVGLLDKHFEIYILSTAPWNNPSAWIDKRLWVEKYLPVIGRKKLILTHRKDLNKGDYLVDDRKAHGSNLFEGKHIHFGQGEFPDWDSVINYLEMKEGISLT